jgi:galactokinase
VVRAPGRVNLLGAHVDYNQGWVLPGAIDRAVWLAAGRGRERRLRLVSVELSEEAALDLDALPLPLWERAAPVARWEDLPAGVAWALEGAGHRLVALDAALASDLPMGAGVSSSAAVEMALVLAWERLSGLELSLSEKAGAGQRAENLYLGVASGIMDQYTCLAGEDGHLVFLDCRGLTHEPVPVPPGLSVLVADTGVRRRLVGSAFNDRRTECEEAVARLHAALPGIRALRDVSTAALERHGELLPETLLRRARHVVEEIARVHAGKAALVAGDLSTFAALLRRSHASSRDLYEVSIPELDTLAEAAWEAPGCHGARLTGGGFGGCVAALVTADRAGDVADSMASAYARRFDRRPEILHCRIAGGAELVAS